MLPAWEVKQIALPYFSNLDINDVKDVEVVAGKKAYSVTVIGPKALVKKITVKVIGHTLHIYASSHEKLKQIIFNQFTPVMVRISVGKLYKIRDRFVGNFLIKHLLMLPMEWQKIHPKTPIDLQKTILQ